VYESETLQHYNVRPNIGDLSGFEWGYELWGATSPLC